MSFLGDSVARYSRACLTAIRYDARGASDIKVIRPVIESSNVTSDFLSDENLAASCLSSREMIEVIFVHQSTETP